MQRGIVCTIIGRDENTLKAAIAHRPDYGFYITGDVRRREFWQSLRNDSVLRVDATGQATAASPAPDILVNAAGVTHSSLLAITTPDCIGNVIDTNLMGTIWACRYIGGSKRGMLSRARMKNRPYNSSIINISSLLAVQGGRGSAAYAASKAGVLGID